MKYPYFLVYFSRILWYTCYICFNYKEIKMKILKISVNDTLEMKKPHPCGVHEFTVLRVGSDVRVKCLGCGRDMTVGREKLEKSIRKVISSEENNTER